MGRPARFEMSWRPALEERFVRLDFRNAFVSDESDGGTPVLSATAYYRPDPGGSSAAGHWFDTRGLVLSLSASLSETEVVTLWGDDSSSERGRTTYRVLGPDRVEVIDEVHGENGYAEFGRAMYERVDG